MAGLFLFIYIAISLQLVLGLNGTANPKNLESYVANGKDTTACQEDQNISKSPLKKSKWIEKSFSIPKEIIIGATILAVPTLAYKICKRERRYFWKGLTYEELPVLLEEERNPTALGYYDGFKMENDVEMKWENYGDHKALIYGYPMKNHPILELKDLDSTIWDGKGDIYSPKVYNAKQWLFTRARCFGLPPYLKKDPMEPEPRYIYHTVHILHDQEYFDECKKIYGRKFDGVKSKNIGEMVDELIEDKDKLIVGKIKTNLPVGYAVQVKTEFWTGGPPISLIVGADGFDTNSGETTVFLACRGTSHISDLTTPYRINVGPVDIIKKSLHLFAHLALNTVPKKED